MFESTYKHQLKHIYYENLKDDLVLFQTLINKGSSELMSNNDHAIILNCYSILNQTYLDDIAQCIANDTDILGISYEVHVLISSPYSEPMNYLLNIIGRHIDINLENFKLFIEILELSMIIDCASNFLIYIVMRENLRYALKKMFKCREH